MLLIDVVCRRMVSPDVVWTTSESAVVGLTFPHMFLQKPMQWHARDFLTSWDVDMILTSSFVLAGM